MESKRDIQNLDPFEFEDLISDLWEARGFDTNVRKKTGDRGVDIEAEKTGYKEVIQVKCYSKSNKIGSQTVREYATLYQQIPTANKVVIVTSGSFTKQGKELADDLNIYTMNGDEVLKELREYDISSISSSTQKTSGVTSEGLDYPERKKRAEDLAESASGDIPAERMTKSGSGNSRFTQGGEGGSPVEVFTMPNPELGIIESTHHQPHFLLTNDVHGLEDIYGTGGGTMWITQKGIHWWVTANKGSRSSNRISEAWRYVNQRVVDTVEYREGIFKNRIIVIDDSGKKYDFFCKKRDPLKEAVEYILSEYRHAELKE